MTTLYKQSAPVLTKFLNNFGTLLAKSKAFADEKGMPHEELLNFRLYHDMRPLTYQVQSACNTARMGFERLGGLEHVTIADDEKTFEDLQARLASTIEWIETLDPALYGEGKEADGPFLMSTARMGDFKFESRQAYLSEYMLPNVHFHMTTAYCIMRHLGVPLGAFDYLKDVFVKA